MLALAVHDRDMRPVNLVGAKQIEIRIQVFDVDRTVRRKGDAVQAHQRSGVVRLRDDCLGIVDAAGQVGTVGKADQPGSFTQQRFQIVEHQFASFRMEPPLLDCNAVFRQTPPSAAVRLVILVGDDDLVAWVQQRQQRMGKEIDIGGGRRADHHFIAIGVDHSGHRADAGFDASCRLRGKRVGSPVVDRVFSHMRRNPGDDGARRETAAGVLEKRPIPDVFGKLRARKADIECGKVWHDEGLRPGLRSTGAGIAPPGVGFNDSQWDGKGKKTVILLFEPVACARFRRLREPCAVEAHRLPGRQTNQSDLI